MKTSTKYLLIAVLVTAICAIDISGAMAQGCSMCAAVGESSTNAGSSAAAGLNKGIMYILLTPYLIIGTIGFIWWRARKKAGQ